MTRRAVTMKTTMKRQRLGRPAAALAALLLCAGLLVEGFSPRVADAAPPPTKDFSRPAVVILGYGLNDNGTMRAILRRRVLTGLTVAQFFPQSPVIVTGGNPRGGNTEAGQMRKMLRVLGFPEERIIVEDRANSTVQNAAFSVPLAEQAGTTGIILVTSSTHQNRADGNFADEGANVLATVSFPDGDPSTNIAQLVRDVISPFITIT